eukprot:scaffold12690_cov37-Tisochrysis_lutea.AAC.1
MGGYGLSLNRRSTLLGGAACYISQLPRGRGVFTLYGTSIYLNIWSLGQSTVAKHLQRCFLPLLNA